jgi:hypothetical protein
VSPERNRVPLGLSPFFRPLLVCEFGRTRRQLLSLATLDPFSLGETRPAALDAVMTLSPGNLNGNVHADPMHEGRETVKGFCPGVNYVLFKQGKERACPGPLRGLGARPFDAPKQTRKKGYRRSDNP